MSAQGPECPCSWPGRRSAGSRACTPRAAWMPRPSAAAAAGLRQSAQTHPGRRPRIRAGAQRPYKLNLYYRLKKILEDENLIEVVDD